MKTQTNN